MNTRSMIIIVAILSVSLVGGSMLARAQFTASPRPQSATGNESALQSQAKPVWGTHSEIFKGPSADDECCRAVTQGEVAVMLAHGLGLAEPTGGWTESKAAAELTRLRRVPRNGWEIRKPIEEPVMRQLLAGSRFAFSQAAVMNQVTVTVARARAVFRDGLPVTQGRFALMLVQAGASSRVNASQPEGLAVEQALLMLTARGIKPVSGWRSDELLTEKAMREILERAGLTGALQSNALPEIDSLPVDLSRAYAVVFEKKNVITQGMIALLLVKISGLPAPAGGWTVESAIAELERFNARPEYGWVPTAPICQSDLARLARRAGVVIASNDRCRVVVSQSQVLPEAASRGPSSFPNVFGGASAVTPPTVGPIFGPTTGTSVFSPGPATPTTTTTGTGGSRQPPVPVPVPPIIIGPELPSNATATPPRARF